MIAEADHLPVATRAMPTPTDDDHDPADDPTDDGALFRRAIGRVRPLPETTPPPAAPKPRPRARMAERDEHAAREEFRHSLHADAPGPGDVLAYRRVELPARAWQRLRAGDYAAEDELDLHHCDAVRAARLLAAFLAHARRERLGCVRIIHGKGLHSDATPVIKALVDTRLRQHAHVLAFHSTPARSGGTGALLVLLARRG
jgi:DNA-nicking Smr family endonuclease